MKPRGIKTYIVEKQNKSQQTKQNKTKIRKRKLSTKSFNVPNLVPYAKVYCFNLRKHAEQMVCWWQPQLS